MCSPGCVGCAALFAPASVNRHRAVMNLEDVAPRLAHPTYIAPTAHVAGDVSLGAGVSVWPGAVVRGDASAVAVGARSAIRERAVVAVVRQGVPTRTGDGGGTGPTPVQGGGVDGTATRIGTDVMVGCGATVHAATLKDGAVVGAGAVVGGGAIVGEKAMVGAGTLREGERGCEQCRCVGGACGGAERARLWVAPEAGEFGGTRRLLVWEGACLSMRCLTLSLLVVLVVSCFH